MPFGIPRDSRALRLFYELTLLTPGHPEGASGDRRGFGEAQPSTGFRKLGFWCDFGRATLQYLGLGLDFPGPQFLHQ